MTTIFRTASAEASARAQGEDEAKARAKDAQRAIIEAALAKKKGGGAAHGPQHDREPKGVGKTKGQFSTPPTRPGQRGRRG
jgi:hypothetical protein